MGNAPSAKERQDDTVDFGALTPQGGVYTGPQDWNHSIVGHLIVDRKLAPFYRPLEDYEEEWDDERTMAARKEDPNAPLPAIHPTPATPSHSKAPLKSPTRSSKDPQRITEPQAYRGAVECPICFLYHPPNINRSRCCDQAICTECFVQIKRADPTPTNLVSEAASCPYCVEPNFGVTYVPPPWRVGIASDSHVSPFRPEIQHLSASSASSNWSDSDSGNAASKKRRKSVSHTSREVVTTDQIRPDWEAKLNAVRAAVTRRENRRIILRQVGDRLIPVGVTSSRLQVVTADGAGTSTLGSNGESAGPIIISGESPEPAGRRSRRRNNDPNQYISSIGMNGPDLEELMVMEAMRLSLLEHEQRQRTEQGSSNNPNNSAPEGSAQPPEDQLRPSDSVSRSSTPSAPPSRASQSSLHSRQLSAPIVPSPLGGASAAIAMAIGLPSPNGPHTSNPSPSSRHSRGPSVGTSRTTLAGALSAAATAGAFVGTSNSPSNPASTRGVMPGGMPDFTQGPENIRAESPYFPSMAAQGQAQSSASPSEPVRVVVHSPSVTELPSTPGPEQAAVPPTPDLYERIPLLHHDSTMSVETNVTDSPPSPTRILTSHD